MTDLPLGWVETTLGEIAETSLGKMLDRGKATGEHAVPYLRNVNVQWGRIDLDDVLTMDIRPEEQEFFRLEPGDLLVCEGGEVGRCAIWPGQAGYMAYQKALHRVRPHKGVEAKYIRYLMEYMSLAGLLVSYSTGSTIKHLPQQQLRHMPLRLPPTAEQHRIVATLEDHLSRIDHGMSQVAELTQRVDRLRGVLRDAAYAQKSVGCTDPKNTSVSWKSKSLGEVLLRIEAGRSFRCEARPASQEEWGVIKVSAMTYGDFREEENKAVAPGSSFNDASEVRPGDILLSRANTESYVGASVLVGNCRPRLLLSDKSLRLVPSPLVDRHWLAHLLGSPSMRREISRRATGTKDSMRNISQASLRDIQIRVPPIDEQHRIVATIDSQIASLNHAKELSDLAFRKARSLRRSLLAEAFVGRLVDQNPSDENASELLQRTRAENGARDFVRRTRRGKGEVKTQKEALL